jgi:N-acylneuraminate cytidylyltransferase/CMP-N,N'-diacetyllegionaminic acid synthase
LENSLALGSTDSDAYANLANKLGLQTPFIRPAEYATDGASAISVVRHALSWFSLHYGYYPQHVMWLQPTSPFRSPAVIRRALDLLQKHEVDAIIGCKEIHRDLTTLFRCEHGYLSALNKSEPMQITRQQSQPLLTPNGAMYLCKTSVLLERNTFYPEKTLPLVMGALSSLDIDSEEDWAMAEAFVEKDLV